MTQPKRHRISSSRGENWPIRNGRLGGAGKITFPFFFYPMGYSGMKFLLINLLQNPHVQN